MLTNNFEEIIMTDLCFYQPEHGKELRGFSLPDEQMQFTRLPNKAIDQAIQDEKMHPVVVLSGNTAVGFFILHYGEGIRSFTDNPNAILLRSFSINHIHQGKGYGKKAMHLVPEFVIEHFPDIDEIVLAVNEKNLAAKQLYEKSGFQDKGNKRMGPKGMQYILHYHLDAKK
ncbi:GNAT family N-acetyltransferase [Scopulibacillus cellulosilyticus]|uniref:GNAT family N-acetyltransferase n=1 Tax=Scopulibacillus cellulosilyticus TaxID=2665665 RepID=A0ABW2PU48_9BACL